MEINDFNDSIYIDVKNDYLHLRLRNKKGRIFKDSFFDLYNESVDGEYILEIEGGMFRK